MLEPADRELYVETLTDAGLLLRGVIDRVDVAPDGAIRVVDYKSSRSPGERFEAKALFQLRFYALVIWRIRGVIPTELRLVYLGNGEILSYRPDADDLLATERKVLAVWEAIRLARETGRLPAEQGVHVPLVCPPGAVSGVRRHSPAHAREGPANRYGRGIALLSVPPSGKEPDGESTRIRKCRIRK